MKEKKKKEREGGRGKKEGERGIFTLLKEELKEWRLSMKKSNTAVLRTEEALGSQQSGKDIALNSNLLRPAGK